MKETVKQGTVIQKKVPELFIDCKNAVAVTGIYQFKGHTGSAFHGIFVAAGGAETAFAAERDKLKLSAVGQPYMAPPKEGLPQLSILSIFSISVFLG